MSDFDWYNIKLHFLMTQGYTVWAMLYSSQLSKKVETTSLQTVAYSWWGGGKGGNTLSPLRGDGNTLPDHRTFSSISNINQKQTFQGGGRGSKRY